MRRLLSAFAVLIGILLVMAVYAPASWLDYGLQRISDRSLGLGDPHGSLWRGSGTLQAILPRGEAVTIGPVSWKIQARELLAGRLHLLMSSDRNGRPVLDAGITATTLTLHDLDIELPAALLGVVSPTLRDADPAGSMALRSREFVVDGHRNTGTVELRWKDAALSLSRVRPLGTYLMVVVGKDEGLDMRLMTLKGDLDLSGSGNWKPGRKLDIDVKATPSAARRDDLVPLLRILGHETSAGTYQLRIDQSINAARS